MKTLFAITAFLTASISAHSALITTPASSTSQTNFDGNLRNNDLVNTGSPNVLSTVTTGSVATYGGDVAPFNSFANLADGLASSKITNNDISRDTYFDGASYNPSPSITYNLNITANPRGYFINQINSISGWADTRTFSNQSYSVSIANVGAPTVFTLLTNVNYLAFNDNNLTPNSSQVTLSDSTGIIAANVAAIRFNFSTNNGSGQVFREIDVLGIAVPEPSLGIMSLAGFLLAFGTWRRRPHGRR